MSSRPDVVTDVKFWVVFSKGGDVSVTLADYASCFWIFELSSQQQRIQSRVEHLVFHALAYREGDPLLTCEEAHSVLTEKSFFKINESIGTLSVDLQRALEEEGVQKRPVSLAGYPSLQAFASKYWKVIQAIPEFFLEQPSTMVQRIKA